MSASAMSARDSRVTATYGVTWKRCHSDAGLYRAKLPPNYGGNLAIAVNETKFLLHSMLPSVLLPDVTPHRTCASYIVA